MSNIIDIDDKKLNEIRKYHNIGKGTYGVVYPYNNMVLKLYYNKLTEDNIFNLSSLLNYEHDNIIFPKALIRNNKDIIGILEDRVDGESLFEMGFNIINDTFDIDLNDFYKLCETAINDIRIISKDKIFMNDIHEENVMYDGAFKFIDTDQYILCKDDSCTNIYNYNLSNFIKTLQSMFEMLNSKVCYEIAKDSNFIYDERYIDVLFEKIYKKIDEKNNFEACCYSLKNLKNYRG